MQLHEIGGFLSSNIGGEVDMGLNEIHRLANALGIENAERMGVDKLIRSIQFEGGMIPCYSEAWSAPCRLDKCPFSDGCSSHQLARVAEKPKH